MCSIFSILNINGDLQSLRQVALRQSRLMRHRGPDWSGIHVCEGGILAHERLDVSVGQRAEELAHHLDTGAPCRAPEEIRADGRHAAARQEHVPRALVERHRVDDRPVDVEDEGGSQLTRPA